MKSIIRASAVFLIITLLAFGVLYPGMIWLVGKAVPGLANGKPIYQNEKLVGFENIGQSFTSPQYFWGRPSAVDYNAAGTGGSNLSPTNPDYLATVQSRIDTLLKYHPGKTAQDIPVELVTASGGGLDPHISKDAALFQAERVSQARGLDTEAVVKLIDQYTEGALVGAFGPENIVNVLKLNLALDSLNK